MEISIGLQPARMRMIFVESPCRERAIRPLSRSRSLRRTRPGNLGNLFCSIKERYSAVRGFIP